MKKFEKFFFVLVFTSLLSGFSYADDSEVAALRAQVKALEARLDEVEKREKTAATATITQPVNSSVIVSAATAPVAQASASPAASSNINIPAASGQATLEVGDKGLSVGSPDKQYAFRLRAYAQADTRTFLGNSNSSNVDNFLIRSARPIVEGKMTDYVNGRLMMDFGNNQTRLLDAYADINPMPKEKLFLLRVGKQKTPIGLERWQSEQDIPLIERGLATNLVPFRDIGVMAYGNVLGGKLEYNLGVSNGAVDLGDNNGAVSDNKDINARVFMRPLEGLGVGVAGTYGDHTGTASAPNLASGYVTIAQSRFFAYASGAYADGVQWRLNPQLTYYNGPFGVIGEYVLNSKELRKASAQDTIKNSGWTAMASYVLTGEKANFEGVKPKNNFNLEKGNYGAFEVVGRASGLYVDGSAFPTFADAAISAKNAREAAIGGTWYFNSSLKFNLNYAHTVFNGGAASGRDREDEDVILSRTQFRF